MRRYLLAFAAGSAAGVTAMMVAVMWPYVGPVELSKHSGLARRTSVFR